MLKIRNRKSGKIPVISTASLPDIVFMLLFFFMVATVMRQHTLMVSNSLPEADQIEKLDKKDMVSYIFVGKPSSRYKGLGDQVRIQLNDKFAEVEDIQSFIFSERADARENLVPFMTTALKVDAKTPMGVVNDIKKELREIDALRINYTTKKTWFQEI